MIYLYYKIISDLFKTISILWKEINGQPKIQRIFLSNESASATQLAAQIYPQAEKQSCEQIDRIADKIFRFLNGEAIRFSLEVLDFDKVKPFQEKVLIAEHDIPRGWVSTYQRIAKIIGNPDGARAVGNALRNNPFPIIIPCHRAIKSDGSIGGFQGGPEMKQVLLEMEGIEFSADGTVSAKYFYY